MEINGRKIGCSHPCYVIAEMSANHEQKFDKAVTLVYAAKRAGADAIKLQTYTPDTLVSKDGRMAEGIWAGQSLYDLYSRAYMPWEWQPKLKQLADDIGITLFSTAYDMASVDFLETIGVPAYKVSSFELTNMGLIGYIAVKHKPMLISTGMGTEEEIDAAFDESTELTDVALLKCTSQYPAPYEDMNLKALRTLKERYGLYGANAVGLSNHSLDRAIPIAAVALGANIIEQHITLSKDSIDGAFSLLPDEFARMVQDVRTTEKAMGNRIGPTESEKQMLSFRWNPKTGKRGL